MNPCATQVNPFVAVSSVSCRASIPQITSSHCKQAVPPSPLCCAVSCLNPGSSHSKEGLLEIIFEPAVCPVPTNKLLFRSFLGVYVFSISSGSILQRLIQYTAGWQQHPGNVTSSPSKLGRALTAFHLWTPFVPFRGYAVVLQRSPLANNCMISDSNLHGVSFSDKVSLWKAAGGIFNTVSARSVALMYWWLTKTISWCSSLF